jgi:hypothetical protein
LIWDLRAFSHARRGIYQVSSPIMTTKTSKLNPEWVKHARDAFQEFLRVTNFPHPVRNGTRGSEFDYPEWLIMFMAVLSVKAHVKHDLAIHRLAVQHWDILAEGLDGQTRTKPISASQLRHRLKKICHSPGRPAAFMFQVFPEEALDEEGQCRQEDDQSPRPNMASEAEATG